MKTKYLYLCLFNVLLLITACSNDDDATTQTEPLDAGSVDFSTYVAIGNSLTSGYTDNALFVMGQENSFPNMLSQKFELIGGGTFTQPLMSDNLGGALLGGMPIIGNRLYFDGAGPAVVSGMPTTEISNIISGPFNNLGIPGAKSFHLIAPGYGNIAGLPSLANPYYVRMATSETATVLEDALAQNPTFFTLWIGNNDVLSYALSGGHDIDGVDTNPTTDPSIFDAAYSTILTALTDTGAKGVVANIPDINSIPHFTTVPYNPIPMSATQASDANAGYAAYNNGLLAVEADVNINLTAVERAKRTIVFAEGNNAVVIEDNTLTDLTGAGLPSIRQATSEDLLLLTSQLIIGKEADGDPSLLYGISVPLGDEWVLAPEEQEKIANATAQFNATILSEAQRLGVAHIDANYLMQQFIDGNYPSGDFNLTSNLVTGGLFSLDGIHPTPRGYALIANEFLLAIDAAYGSNFKASGSLYDIGTYPTNFPAVLP